MTELLIVQNLMERGFRQRLAFTIEAELYFIVSSHSHHEHQPEESKLLQPRFQIRSCLDSKAALSLLRNTEPLSPTQASREAQAFVARDKTCALQVTIRPAPGGRVGGPAANV